MNHKWNCDGTGVRDEFFSGGGDAILLSMCNHPHCNGAWCDWDSNRNYQFICEGFI